MKKEFFFLVLFLITSISFLQSVNAQEDCSEWQQIYGTCLDIKGKAGVEYQKCYIGETETEVVFKFSLRSTAQGMDSGFYKKGMKIFAGDNDTVIMSCSEFNENGYTTEVKVKKQGKYQEWDSEKKAFYLKLDKKYEKYKMSYYVECLRF